MQVLTNEFTNLVDQLLVILDRDIDRLTTTLFMLDDLRGLLIKRDDAALGKLLEDARLENARFSSVERSRQEIRAKLAALADCLPADMTLTALSEILTGQMREDVLKRREELGALVEKMQAEHLNTSMLIGECSRFNRLMLQSLFGGKGEGTTYSRSGVKHGRGQQNIMNVKY
jgi:hypothetical protein